MEGDTCNSVASGGGQSALNPLDEKDRGAIRTAAKRWPKRFAAIDEKKRTQWVEALDVAERTARNVIANGGATHLVGTDGKMEAVFESPLEAAKVLVSVVKTGAVLDAAQQRDEHAEAGVAESNVTITNNTIIAIPPPVRARITDE